MLTAPSLAENAVPIALTAVLGLQVWVVRTVITLRIVLVGENGDNGLKSEVAKLRKARHRHGNVLTNVLGRLHLLDGQTYQDAAGEGDE
jgi:hypothetical protein